MGEIKFIVGLVMAGLFVIAIMTYAFNFASDNNAAIDLGDEDRFAVSKSEVEANTTQFVVKDINTSSRTFEESTLEAGSEVMEEGATFKVGRKSLLSSVKSTLSLVRTYIFGGSSDLNIFLTAIFSVLSFIGIRYVYKSWIGKNPD
jgi:hypothetical protein